MGASCRPGPPAGRVDATDAESLTRAEIQLRHEGFQALMHLRKHLPGYEEARVSLTWPQLGVRLSRRIHGLYRLTDDDLKASRQFPDGIARMGIYFPDWGPNYLIKGLRYDVPIAAWCRRPWMGSWWPGAASPPTQSPGTPCVCSCPAWPRARRRAWRRRSPRARGANRADVPVETLREELRAQDVYLGSCKKVPGTSEVPGT